MYWVTGAHRHPNDEVNLLVFSVTPRYSLRGLERSTIFRADLSGDLIYTGQAALAPKIAELIDAYSLPNMDVNCGLYHDDGTPTRHKLESSTTNANNISGVKLVHRSWPRAEPEEYATGRSFRIVLEAEYKNPESELLEFRESVRKVGTGGPRFRYTEFATRVPRREIVNQFTKQEIVQEGYAKGLSGYVNPPGPLLPALEDEDLRMVELVSPDYAGRRYVDFITRWRYVMTAPTNITVIPNAFV